MSKPIIDLNMLNIEKAKLIWESIFFIFFFINSLYALYFFVPYSIILKIIITIISFIVIFDIFKNFIYVRWILLKEE
jgi:hypothetical protein